MLVQATGAPAFSAACAGGNAGSQCTAEKAPRGDPARRVRHQPDQRRRHDLGLDHLPARSKPASAATIGVLVNAARDQHIDRDTGAVEILRHDRGERLDAAFEGP